MKKILNKFNYSPVLMDQEGVFRLISDLQVAEKQGFIDLSLFFNQRNKAYIDDNGVGHIFVQDGIGHKLAGVEKLMGYTDVKDLSSELAAIDSSRAVMLHVSSPGGTVTGVPEVAKAIADLDKPVMAYTDDLMASAAYYLSAGADYIWASESARVGSIGVFIHAMDYSEMLEKQGLQTIMITNKEGDLKGINPAYGLTEDQFNHLQAGVQKTFEKFRGFCLTYRDIPDSAMRGQCLEGGDALESNLIDGLGSAQDAYNYLLSRVS